MNHFSLLSYEPLLFFIRVIYTKRADRHTYNIPDTIASHLIQPCPNRQVYNVLPDYRPNHIAPQRYIRHFYRFHVIPEVEYVRYKSGCFLLNARLYICSVCKLSP